MTQHSSLWKKIRNIFNQVHLYAGLLSGLIVIAVCLSGTIYVYNTEIREKGDSERYFVEVGSQAKSLDVLKSELEEKLGGNVTSVFLAESMDRSVQFSVLKEGEEGRGTTYFVNPYTSEVLADNSEQTGIEKFMSYIFSLHRWLLLDRIETPILESMGNRDLGRLINGIATSLFLLGVLTGMVIWFPQKVKNWKQGLKVKWSANWKRVNHDLHNTLAFYSLFAIFLMSVTGPFWSFQWYRESWQKTWDIDQAPPSNSPQKSKKLEEAGSVLENSLDAALIKANEILNYPGNVRISIPKDSSEPISISKYRTGFFARAGVDQLLLSQDNLVITELKLFSEMSLRQQIGRSVKSLHTGEIFGQFTKFFWFLASLIATSLPVTGTLIWWNKRKKKSSRKKKRLDERIHELA